MTQDFELRLNLRAIVDTMERIDRKERPSLTAKEWHDVLDALLDRLAAEARP